MTPTHKATCHCGAVELAIDWTDGIGNMRRCDCSMCRRKGAIMVTAVVGTLEVVKGADMLSLYTFNTDVAKHYFCSNCGIYTHHQRRSNPDEFGVNAGCVEGLVMSDLEPVAWSDGINHPSDR